MLKWLSSLFSSSQTDSERVDSEVNEVQEDSNKGDETAVEEIIDIYGDNVPLSWKDQDTGLIWEVKNEENLDDLFTYEEAIAYAQTMNRKHYDSSAKWRLPTIDELMTLGSAKLFDYRDKGVKYKTRNSWKEFISHKRNGKLFVKLPLSGFMNDQIESWYWSSTEVGTFKKDINDKGVTRMVDMAWAVNFFEGGNYHNSKEEKNSVICVREK